MGYLMRSPLGKLDLRVLPDILLEAPSSVDRANALA
jgi:hypothetical protein